MKKIAIALLTILSIISVSCQIGLGAAVDTEPPALTIQNPPIDSVIRDDFAIVGTYSDDGKIESVVAQVERTDGSGYSETFTGVLNGKIKARTEGTYTIVIPAKTSKITDGSYQAIVTIKDETGRTTIRNTTFTIDNTPPVIVLQRPGTDINATLSNADTYGQLFTLEGLGADDSNIDHINVDIYGDKAKTDYKTTVTLNNVPPSISLDVAKYGDEAYKKIYGDVAPADFIPQQYYCSITAFDGAQRYPADGSEQTAADLLGNPTSDYYIYEEISNSVLKQAKVTDIYHILNGSFGLDSSRSSGIDTAAILDTLALKKKTVGSFVLDPKNNPTYSIAGKPTLLAGENAECLKLDSDYTVSNDSDITVQVNIGLDNSPIVNDENFKVYFQKCKFENGKYVGYGDLIEAPVVANGKKKIGSNYQFTVNVKSSANGLEVEKPYLVIVNGKDENNQPIVAANNGYGFYLVSLSSAPTLKNIIPSDATVYVKEDGSLTIQGVTRLTEGKPVVSIRYGEIEWDSKTVTDADLVEGKTDEYNFEFTIPNTTFKTQAEKKADNTSPASTEFALEIRSSNGEDKSTSTYKTVYFDVDNPEVNEVSITPEINTTEPLLLNGEISVTGLVEDIFSGVKGWKYQVWEKNATDPSRESAFQTQSRVSFTYDTTLIEDLSEIDIKILAEDKAGNEYPKVIACKIDQSTDKPKFEAQDGVTWEAGILNPYYINAHAADVQSKNIISGGISSKITDDDSVAYVLFEVQAVKPKTEVSEEDKAKPAYAGYDADATATANLESSERYALYKKTGKEVSVTHKMPGTTGFYFITQTAYDKNFKFGADLSTLQESEIRTAITTAEANDENKNYFTKKTYVVKIPGTGPQYTLTQDTKYVSEYQRDNSKTVKVTINIENGEAPYTFKRNGVAIPTTKINDNTYEDEILVSDIYKADGDIVVTYAITDANDTTKKTIQYYRDNVKPTFTKAKLETDSNEYSVFNKSSYYYLNNKDQKFTVSGQASDSVSGVETINLEIINVDASGNKINSSRVITDSNKTGFFDEIEFANYEYKEDGTTIKKRKYWQYGAKITVTVTDAAGNVSDETVFNVKFDTQGPNGVHLLDSSSGGGKDLYFRIGDQNRDDFVKKNKIGELVDVSGNVLDSNGNGIKITQETIIENGVEVTYTYSGVPEWDNGTDGVPSKDKDVGGKYSGNTYGNAETVKLRGKFEDKVSDAENAAEGSGVDIIYYKVFPSQPNSTNNYAANFLDNYKTQADGYFSLLKTPETRRVFYTDNSTGTNEGKLGGDFTPVNGGTVTITKGSETSKKYYTDITTNYKTTIANLSAGVNYLVLVAVDNVGNAALEGVEYNGVTYNDYRINVDYESPTISSNAPAIGVFTNASQPLTITGTVKDNPSANHAGIKSVWLKYDETKANWIKADVNETDETWTATISVETLDEIYGSSTTPVSKLFTATATDNSGKGNTFSCNLTVTIDQTPPTVEVSVAEKSNAGTNDDVVAYVNGSIKLKGTASDTNGLKEGETIKLYYTINADEKDRVTDIANWTPYTRTQLDSSNNEWTLNTDASPFGDGTYYFTVAATDKAGNTGYAAPLALAVNKASDRPIVKFSISFSDDISSSNSELDGVISDDDGTPEVNNVWCAVTEDTTDENGNLVSGDVVPAEDSSEWKQSETGANAKFTYKATGSFTLKPGDGKKYIWFKIKDAKNTTPFISSNATTYSFNTPKLCDKDNLTTGVTSTRLIVTTDTTPPVTDSFAYLAKNKDAAIDANWLTNNNSAVFGGTNANTFKVRIFAWDKNGISSVTFKVPAEEGDNPTTATSGKLADGYYIYSLDEDTTKHPADTAKASYNCWTSGDVDVTGFVSGTRSCIVTTFDGTKTKEESYTFTIDNTPADFKYTTHKDDQTIYGVRSEEIRGMVLSNDVQNVYYYLTNGDVATPADAKTAIGINWKTVLLENSSNEFSLVFDKDSEDTVTNESETHDLKLRYWLKTLYNVSNLDTYDTTQVLKLWVYLEDKVGNKSDPKSLSLNVIPNGGKPFVEINYPEAGAKLGGTIRFAGITTIDETSTVEKVYAQILVPGANASDWVSKLDALITDSKNKSTGTEPYYKPVTFDLTKTGDEGKGVEVSGTPSSWNFAINSHHELEKDNDTPEYTLKFIAKSASDKISDTVSRTIQIDKNAPSIGNTIPLQLVKFVDTTAEDLFADSNISNRMTYQEDMWISDEWYLIGSVTDDNGVKSLLWHDGSVSHTLVLRNDTTNTGTPQTVANVILKPVELSTTSTAYDYHFAIKIGKTSGSGTITYKISAVDATSESNSVERTVKVNYDNTPPDFKATVSSLDGAEELSSNGISIQNSSGMYPVYGTFDEEGTQSGFERIVMYFTRTIGSGDPENIVDPMVTKNRTGDNNDKKNNYYPIGSFSYTSVEDAGDGIYWKELTGASTNSDTITVTVSDDWVRKGGLCKVDGVIYKITEVTTTSIKVEGTLNSGSSKKVYVSPALVIDNLSSESKKSGATYNGLYDKTGTERNVINGGDGDWMIEGVTKQSSSYPWTAAINSQNMLDGPITIHFVAFDKAGNATEKTYSGKVENNAPRLAGVTIWTDYNGNNKGWRNSGAHAADYASETKSRYYSRVRPTINNKLVERSNDITSKLIVSGNQDDEEGIAASSSTAFMKVTDTVKFIPEIVGGNGALYYEYKIGKKGAFTVDSNTKKVTGFTPSTANNSKALQSSSKAAIKNDSDVAVSGADVGQDIQSITQTDENSINYIDGNTDGVITFDGAGILGNLDNSTSDVPTWFDVIISDSTEGDTPLSCELQVALQINYHDEVAPLVKIRPFYWNSKAENENSVVWDTTSGNALGHIELENDLPTSNFPTGTTSGEYDRDPKVSGKIKIEGYAYDDIKLAKLYVQVEGHTALATAQEVSSYAVSSSQWSATAYSDTTGWGFSAQDIFCNANGHLVRWTLTIDTAKRTNVAEVDQEVVVYADGARGTTTGTNPSKTSVHKAIDHTAANNPQTSLVTKKWSEAKNDTGATDKYYTDIYGLTKVSDTTADDDIVYTNDMTPYYKVDVVPYITGIKTELAVGKRPTVLSRSALGLYPVRRGSSISIEGFNLTGATTGVSLAGTSIEEGRTATATGGVTVPVGTGISSGVVEVSVNSVSSLNNKTAKSITTGTGDSATTRIIEYNTEPNGQNNDNLTDKRELKIVDVTTTTDTTDKRMLDMAVNGNNLYFSTGYGADYFSTMSVNGTSVNNISYLRRSYTRYFDNAIAINGGSIYTVSACGDSYWAVSDWSNGPSHFALTKGNVTTAHRWEYGSTHPQNYSDTDPSNNSDKIYLESNWNGANLNNLDRFKNPDIVVKTINSTQQGVISYYDTTQKLIKFRYFTPTTNAVASNYESWLAGTESKQIVEGTINTNATYSQSYIPISGADENSSFSAVGVIPNGTALVSWYDATNGILKIKSNTSPSTSFSGYQVFNSVPRGGNTITFNISVDGGNSIPIEMTYTTIDGETNGTTTTGARSKHEFAYQLSLILSKQYGAYAEVDPKTNSVVVRSMQTGNNSKISITNVKRNGTAINNAMAQAVDGYGVRWEERNIDDESAGQYVVMKTDSKGGIHFAYYDTGNGDLKYAYMSSVTATPVVVTVDGYQQVGQYVDLALKETTDATDTTKTYVTPYISYYSMSNGDSKRAAKVAKLVNPITYSGTTTNSTSVTDGSVDELFTGAWEAMHIPTNGIPVQYRINVGVTSGGNVYIGYLADRQIEYVKVE